MAVIDYIDHAKLNTCHVVRNIHDPNLHSEHFSCLIEHSDLSSRDFACRFAENANLNTVDGIGLVHSSYLATETISAYRVKYSGDLNAAESSTACICQTRNLKRAAGGSYLVVNSCNLKAKHIAVRNIDERSDIKSKDVTVMSREKIEPKSRHTPCLFWELRRRRQQTYS